MNILFATDFHIIESDLPEINAIFDELLIIKDKYCVNKLIIPGDSFDKISPTSKELDCLSSFLKKMDIPTVLLAANSHESTSQTESVINHFGILQDTINVVKEYHDNNKLFVGHFIVNSSSRNFGGTVDLKSLSQYKYVVLGHGHNPEMISPNICQLGSIRYIDFGEDPKLSKIVAICTNYETNHPKWLWIPINSLYPMINIELGQNDKIDPTQMASNSKSSISQAQSTSNSRQFSSIMAITPYLDQLDPKTKVRVIFQDYGLWREFLPLSETYKNKFFKFVEKKDFIMSSNLVVAKQENITLKESLLKFLETNKIPEEIKKILLNEL